MGEPGQTNGTLGSRIFRARVEAGLSRKQLATMCSCSARSILFWEQNARTPGSQRLLPLSRATGKPLDYFLAAFPDPSEVLA